MRNITPPSSELKELVKNTLGLTEAALISKFRQLDNCCFKTLNSEAHIAFTVDGFDINELTDLMDFIGELR